jgi:mono/diheme cytochrome c family protein
MHRHPSSAVCTAVLVFASTLASVLWGLSAGPVLHAQGPALAQRTGQQIYEAGCAQCHGPRGKGAAQPTVAFDLPLPDLTDCNFTREPDGDWFAVIHDGGPARAFDKLMPAFGDALTRDEIDKAIAHVRTFCDSAAWPRGELNFPRALVTEKAFPEDEAVFTTSAATEGDGELANKLIYEKRFGQRSQVEVIIPFASLGSPETGWATGIGDVAFGAKSAVYHSRRRGTILSVAGEVIMPTGDQARGLGSGHWAFEPFASFGQALPRDAFIQAQAGMGLPLDGSTKEAFWRLVLGKSFTQGAFGRTWSPMAELVAARDLADGETTHWDIVPQFQVTLSKRQHIMAAVGARVPLNDAGSRSTKLVMYFLWDWFDGGLFSAWK